MNKVTTVFRILEKTHQPTMLELLGHYTPFQILIMTMLSARTKDSTTIPIVQQMFKKYSSPEDFVQLEIKELEKILYRIGFFRTKAKNVKKLSEMILARYDGNVPDTLEELASLPGIGRKTANCILNYVFNKPAIAVDVHVHRIANRLGWIDTNTAEQTEQELQGIIPREEWINVNKLLVGHGQTICIPIKPKCPQCLIKEYCNYGKMQRLALGRI